MRNTFKTNFQTKCCYIFSFIKRKSFPGAPLSGIPIEVLELEYRICGCTYARMLALYRFLGALVVVVVVILEVTPRIIYVIHSANIGAPCRKAFA